MKQSLPYQSSRTLLLGMILALAPVAAVQAQGYSDQAQMITDREQALDTALRNVEAGGSLYMLCGYTPTQEFRRIMQKRGWVRHFWEE